MIDYLRRVSPPALENTATWQNPKNAEPGLEITTKHYRVYTTLLDPLVLSQVPGFLESCYRGYQSQLPRPITTGSKFTIYLFADRLQWEDFTDDFTGKHALLYKQIKKGAYYHKGACITYNIGRERTFSVLGHEGWHQFNKRHFKYRLPSWLDEGIAMQFETSRYEGGFFEFEPERNLYRLGGLKKTLEQNRMMPLAVLLATSPGEVVASEDRVNAFYAQAYALVRFLREEDYGRRLPDYQQMLLGALDGTWPLSEQAARMTADRNVPFTIRWNRRLGPRIFTEYIAADLQTIDRQYHAFCRKITYHVRLKDQSAQ
jgi:hypothetical protein